MGRSRCAAYRRLSCLRKLLYLQDAADANIDLREVVVADLFHHRSRMSCLEVTPPSPPWRKRLAHALPFRYGAGHSHFHRTAIMRRIGMAVLGLTTIVSP